MDNVCIKMYHGGRGLEFAYREIKPSSTGRWEYGPGLYVTNHYERARKYAKGGGKVYEIELEVGRNIREVDIKLDNVVDFIKNNVSKSKFNELLADVHDNLKRMNKIDELNAEVFLNLIINGEYIKGNKTIELCKFLVGNGVDYLSEHRFGGWDETICSIFNRDKIKSVKVLKAKDVEIHNYVLNVDLLKELENKKASFKIKNTAL